MKTLTAITALATFFTVNMFAQTGPINQQLSITVTSNMLQQPVATTMEFKSTGNNGFDTEDTTTIPNRLIVITPDSSSTAAADSIVVPVPSVYPFTVSAFGICVDKFNSRSVLDSTMVFPFGI